MAVIDDIIIIDFNSIKKTKEASSGILSLLESVDWETLGSVFSIGGAIFGAISDASRHKEVMEAIDRLDTKLRIILDNQKIIINKLYDIETLLKKIHILIQQISFKTIRENTTIDIKAEIQSTVTSIFTLQEEFDKNKWKQNKNTIETYTDYIQDHIKTIEKLTYKYLEYASASAYSLFPFAVIILEQASKTINQNNSLIFKSFYFKIKEKYEQFLLEFHKSSDAITNLEIELNKKENYILNKVTWIAPMPIDQQPLSQVPVRICKLTKNSKGHFEFTHTNKVIYITLNSNRSGNVLSISKLAKYEQEIENLKANKDLYMATYSFHNKSIPIVERSMYLANNLSAN